MWRLLLLLLASTASAVVLRSPTLSRGGSPAMVSSQTKAEKVVMQRLNPLANLDNMNEVQLRKYAYAMQIEMRRLIREEQRGHALRERVQLLLNDAEDEDAAAASMGIDVGTLIAAMKLEGLVRYGLAYATKATSWDRVRKKHPELASFSDAELLATFQASGCGISGSFGDLF